MRIAIVTAYYRETRAVLARCIDSVRAQTAPVEHILVADGEPQEWAVRSGARHVTLDRSHGDFGDTPRAVGLALAVREGYDAVQFLDADNLILPHHAAMAGALLEESGAHLLVLKRRFLRSDGSVMPYTAPGDEALTTIDTNCYFFARAAFPTALKWTLVPRELSFMGDRVFRSVFVSAGHPVAVAREATVGYTSMIAATYRAVGEEPPPGCRDHQQRSEQARAWWLALDAARRSEIEQTLGVKIVVPE